MANHNRFATTRFNLFLLSFFFLESIGILAAAMIKLREASTSAPNELEPYWRVQRWWGWTLGSLGFFLFGLKLRVSEVSAAEAELLDRPLLLLVRHASTADTILPMLVVQGRTGVRLSYVLKSELRWDPCIDIYGSRLPNVFTKRQSGKSVEEIQKVAALGVGHSAGSGVCIFPEGTRYTRAKHRQRVEQFRESGKSDLAERAAKLKHVLPPRMGGVLALLGEMHAEQQPFRVGLLGHTGFEKTTTIFDFFSGAFIGSTVQVKVWSWVSEDLPSVPAEQVEWLWQCWEELDRWIDGFGDTETEAA